MRTSIDPVSWSELIEKIVILEIKKLSLNCPQDS